MFIFNDWEVKQKQEELSFKDRIRAKHGWEQEPQHDASTENVLEWIMQSILGAKKDENRATEMDRKVS